MEAATTPAVAATTGQRRPSPSRTRRSRVWVWWSTTPTSMNSAALKIPWAISSVQPANTASSVPAPKSTIMKPSWLIVP